MYKLKNLILSLTEHKWYQYQYKNNNRYLVGDFAKLRNDLTLATVCILTTSTTSGYAVFTEETFSLLLK